jgi:hypothetical protein
MLKAIKVTPENMQTIRNSVGADENLNFRGMEGFYLVIDTTYRTPWDYFPPELFHYHFRFEVPEREDNFTPVREVVRR